MTTSTRTSGSKHVVRDAENHPGRRTTSRSTSARLKFAIPRSLGDLEAAVLAALWASASPLSVRDVHVRVVRRPPLAYTTVLTVLDRLHAKGIVSREMHGKAYAYRPTMSRQAWLGAQAAQVLTADPENASRGVLMAFLDSAERTDPEVIERLSELIAVRRRGRST